MIDIDDEKGTQLNSLHKTSTERDNAGVYFPPPLIYVIALGLGWLLNRRVAAINVPDVIGPPVAYLVVFVLIGFGILGWAAGMFRRAGTATLPMRPTSAIVESGPYQFTRNPMYVGLAFIYLGIGTMIGGGWALVLLPVLLSVIYLYVIRREERYLTGKFGQQYLDYKERVRRWI